MAKMLATIEKNGDGLWHARNGKTFACLDDDLPGTIPDKLQPHNVEAERAVLGSLLIDPDSIVKTEDSLAPADFYLEKHAWIYETMLELSGQRQPIDLLLISDLLQRRHRLDEIGGDAYLTGLTLATPTSIHVEHYANQVSRAAILRRLGDAAGEIARLAYDDNADLEDVVDRAEQIVFTVGSQARKSKARGGHISGALDRFYDTVEYLQQHKGMLLGIPTGISDLDRLLKGLQPSKMYVLAGRPGMGKSALALNVARNAAKKWGKRVGIYSLEMADIELVQRLVSAETGIDSQRLQLGDIHEHEWGSFVQASSLLSSIPIFIDDTPAISVTELRSKARRLHAEHGLDLLILDYLQLMRGDYRSQNREQEISYISRNVKALAKELDIPVLALSQLSRKCEDRHDKRPMLSDLRDSGSIEQDADVAMFIYRDDAYNPNTEFPNIAEIIVGKHRGGPTGVFSVYFKKHLTQFVDLEVRKQPLYEPMPERNGNGKSAADVLTSWQEKLAA